jgi:hypothetical protein
MGSLPVVLLLSVLVTTEIYAQTPTTTTTTTTTANSTNATANATAIITELNYYHPNMGRNETVPLPAQAIQFQSSDSSFARLVQLLSQCVDFINAMNLKGGSGSMILSETVQLETCTSLINQGVNSFCSFEALDVLKCNAAKEMILPYQLYVSAFF